MVGIYAAVGIAAPYAPVATRLIQGFAIGGEYGGAPTGWIQTAATLGLLLALAVILSCRTLFGEDAFRSWAWRIPFVISAGLLGLSLWIRMRLDESPRFRRMQEEGRTSQSPLRESFLRWNSLKLVPIALFGLLMGQGVVWYTAQFYTQFYLEGVLKVASAHVNALIMTATPVSAVLHMFFAWLSDRLGRKPVMLFGLGLAAVSFIPGFQLLAQSANPALTAAAARAPVTVIAAPADCSLQFDLVSAILRRRFPIMSAWAGLADFCRLRPMRSSSRPATSTRVCGIRRSSPRSAFSWPCFSCVKQRRGKSPDRSRRVERDSNLVFTRTDDQRRLHARHILRGGESFGNERLERGKVPGHAFQEEVHFARQHVTLAHRAPVARLILEFLQIGVGLARKPDEDEAGDFIAERPGVQFGVIPLDETRLFQRPHAPETRRRRNLRPARQLHIGDSAVVLQFGKNAHVDGVELVALHVWSLDGDFGSPLARGGDGRNKISGFDNFLSDSRPILKIDPDGEAATAEDNSPGIPGTFGRRLIFADALPISGQDWAVSRRARPVYPCSWTAGAAWLTRRKRRLSFLAAARRARPPPSMPRARCWNRS
jgi:MFS family permease